MGCCQSKSIDPPTQKKSGNDPSDIMFAKDSASVTNEKFIRKSNFIQTKRGDIKHFYEIVKEIGSGGFGVVFTVKDKRSGLMRAMKELPKDKMDAKSNAKMLEEVEILRELVNFT